METARSKEQRQLGQLTLKDADLRTIGTYGCSYLGRIVKLEREVGGKGPTDFEFNCPCGRRHEVSDPHWRKPRTAERGEVCT